MTPDGVMLEGFAAQAEQAWNNVLAVLEAAGMGVEDLVHVNIYYLDKGEVATVRATRDRFLGDHKPSVDLRGGERPGANGLAVRDGRRRRQGVRGGDLPGRRTTPATLSMSRVAPRCAAASTRKGFPADASAGAKVAASRTST